jgi:hypothetical protein
MSTPAQQLTAFIAKFDPSVAKLVRSARSVLRKEFPTAIELVYDNYNALAIGYSTSERVSDVLFSLAVYPRWIDLYFMNGRSLPDPNGLLRGSGKKGAFVRLDDLSMLNDAAVKMLLDAAVRNSNSPLPAKGKGYTVIKSISAKQRSRRPRS